jgi:cobalamin biosynthesis protein CobT
MGFTFCWLGAARRKAKLANSFIDEQQSDEQQSDEQQSDEQQSDEQQSDEQQSDEQQSSVGEIISSRGYRAPG